MAIQTFLVSSYPAAEDRLRSWLLEQENPVILAATKDSADELLVRMLQDVPGLVGVERNTPAGLAAILAAHRLAERGLAPLSRLAAEALATRCAHQARMDNRLVYFHEVASMPGFGRRLAATLADLRMERIDPGRLSDSGLPGRDLALLLQLFKEALSEESLADLSDLFQLATAAIQSGDQNRVMNRPLLFLDVSPQSLVEEEFYQALVGLSPDGLVTTLEGDSLAREAWDSVLTSLKSARSGELLEISGQVHRPTTGEPSDETPVPPGTTIAQEVEYPEQVSPTPRQIDRLRRRLFSPSAEADEAEPDGSFEFFSAPGEGRECVEMARRIMAQAKRDVPFDSMAVLLRNPELYQPQLEDAFQRAGIPAYFSRGTRRPDPAGRAFLVLLDCKLEKLTASRFAEYLSLGQVPDLAPSGAPPEAAAPWVSPSDEIQLVFKTNAVPPEAQDDADLDEDSDERSRVIAGGLQTPLHWEKLLVDAAVIGGRDRWERRLKGLEEELKLKHREADEEDWRRGFYETQIRRLHVLQDFALPLIDFLDRLPDRALWGEWLEHFQSLAGMALRRPESVLEVLTELEPMKTVGPVGLLEVFAVLQERLTFLRREPPRRRFGRVFVGTPQEASGRFFEFVFVPGLGEGIFPRKVQEDPLLLDEYRRMLSSTLTVREDRTEEERLLLRKAAAAASNRLTVSYPRMDLSQGRARVPSLYFLELIRAAEGHLPGLSKLERRASDAAQTRIGWPAPRNPEAAIDDAEFDLAVLDPLLHDTREEVTGKARFLLETNPFLARSLRSRYKRWNPEWSDDDGIVAHQDAELREALQQYRPSGRSYSPTALQSYAACPYRFFLYGIQRLQPRETPAAIEQMDPLIRGSFFHDAQFELFRRLQNDDLLPVEATNLEEALEVLDSVLRQIAARYHEQLAPAIPRIWQGEIEEIRLDLRTWIRTVARQDQQWLPQHFEFSFGLKLEGDHDPASTEEEAVILEGYHLRGKIDLVEKHREFGYLRVTDHKTGRAPRPAPRFVGKGEILQPLLYGLAAEALLGEDVDQGRLYFCTHRGDFQEIPIILDHQSRQKIREVMGLVDQGVASGFLPAAPREDACTYCDFRPVCGPYEELRTRRKDRNALADLEKIRSIP